MTNDHRAPVKAFAVALLATAVTLFAQDKQPLPYPDGFRTWTHIKSLVVGPDHESYAKRGGIHHYYANDKAVAGYHTGNFPDGERRFLDVMVKDGGRYGSTGGWGYEHFDRNDCTGRLSGNEQATCSACHVKAPTDHVFSRIRP